MDNDWTSGTEWKECAEIAKKAVPNYRLHFHKERRVCEGDKIAKAITERTHQIYLGANGLSENIDAYQHLLDRQNKFWDDLYDTGSISAGLGEDD